MLLTGPAVAQNWTQRATTYVPFDFVVNDTTLPAGNYVVSTYDIERVLLIKNRENGEYATYVRNVDLSKWPSHESSQLVFALNGKVQHVLHQIRLEGDNHTHDIIHGNEVAELVANR